MALTYKKRYELLLNACRQVVQDCNMALDGTWDKSDEGFRDTRDLLIERIEKATGKTEY